MTIEVKLIAYSRAPNGKTICSWELTYPRFIHSELMTHRLFSRNAASSRAIPVDTLLKLVRESSAKPVSWGKNQPGMQASEQFEGHELDVVIGLWESAAFRAAEVAEMMAGKGVHKQIANRILEPFQNIKTIVTATDMDNFFWLRNHTDAQPEIHELARLMWETLEAATPFDLKPGEWHVPYVWTGRSPKTGEIAYGFDTGQVEDGTKVYHELSLENALQISSSCCAQVSYRKLDDSLEKAQSIFKRLVESTPVHASPFEHCATPMENPDFSCGDCQQAPDWEKGVTHADRNGKFWSGNFMGWIQMRQLIPGNVCNEYVGH